MRFILRRLWVDTDEMLQVEVFFEGVGYSATQDIYVYPDTLQEFGEKLQKFPTSISDEVVLEVGSIEDGHYSWLKLRAYVYDGSGHTAFEISVNNNGVSPAKALSQFSVLIEAASLNSLGKEIKNWTINNENSLLFTH